MKYLKLFENYNFYSKISEEDYYDNHIETSVNDDQDLYVTGHKIDKEYIKILNKLIFKGNVFIDQVFYIEKNIGYYRIRCFITQDSDEWFWVKITKTHNGSTPMNSMILFDETFNKFDYYKCDQFDGLIKCLKDNQIIR